VTSRIPALGSRGEGWVVAQVIVILVVAGLGLRDLAANGWVNAWGPAAVAIGLAAIVAGLLLVARAARDLRGGLSPFPRPVAGAPLVESGVYRRIRHPIYSGLLLAAFGWGVLSESILAVVGAVLLFLVLDAKSRREEEWLTHEHPTYLEYRRRTRRFVPGLY